MKMILTALCYVSKLTPLVFLLIVNCSHYHGKFPGYCKEHLVYISRNPDGAVIDFESYKYAPVTMSCTTSIQKGIMAVMHYIKIAYNYRLTVRPSLAGNVNTMLVIDQNGNILYAKITSSTLDDCILETELLEIVSAVKFTFQDPLSDLIKVNYPFVFSREGLLH